MMLAVLTGMFLWRRLLRVRRVTVSAVSDITDPAVRTVGEIVNEGPAWFRSDPEKIRRLAAARSR
jgi:hypothetical protein